MTSKNIIILFVLFFASLNNYAQTYQEADLNLTGVGNNSVSQWVDYDNDNDLDIFVAGRTGSSSATSKLYTNVDSTFVDSGIQFGWIEFGAADWGDFDNDGDPDLLLCGQGGDTQPVTYIYRNDGNDVFKRLNLGFARVEDCTCKWFDYDNDGDLDILISGDANSISVTKLYQNLGNEDFKEVETNLPNVLFSSVSIGDYDNDGDLDLFLSGLTYSGGEKFANIFRNEGGGQFTKLDNGFPKVVLGSGAWGDYDNDGDLDLAICGYLSDNFGSSLSDAAIYRNDGNDQFTRINTNLVKVYYSSIKWADYDNDGDLDLLLAGRYDDGSVHDQCYLYRNDENDTFNKTNDNFFTIFRCDVDLGDYDNDGDLDILISGDTGGSSRITKVYNNQMAHVEYAAQNAITNPVANVNNHSVNFTWQSSQFSSTPVLGQSFNIRIGTKSGSSDIMSACSDTSTSRRKTIELGNVQSGTKWQINNLEGGVYYWTVQGVDHSYKGSNFSKEMFFSIVPWPPKLIEPLDSAGNQSVHTNLLWTYSKSADSYQLQVSKFNDFSKLEIDNANIGDTFYTVQNLDSSSTYYWRVRAKNIAGYSNWSETWSYTTEFGIPHAQFTSLQKEGKVPLTVQFIDSSSYDVNSWKWDFENDGVIDSYQQNPAWTYFEPDTISVKLIVSNGIFSDTLIKKNQIIAYLDSIPNLFSIKDVPNDQGGWVKVRFAGSVYDTDSLILAKTKSPKQYTIEIEDDSGWTAAATTVAYGKYIYSILVPTTKDSTNKSNGLINFRVIAAMNEGNYASKILSGYSVDNLFPSIPSELSAIIENTSIRLNWKANTEKDFNYYTIYRSKNNGNYIEIAKTIDSSYLDTQVEWGVKYSYLLSATDFSNNESDFSNEIKIIVTNVDNKLSQPTKFILSQNYPNPFNPSTTIKYQIPKESFVTLKVYDAIGREVATLVNKQQSIGYYNINFNAANLSSGIYFYQITAGDYTSVKKMLMLK